METALDEILHREIKGLIDEFPVVGRILDEYGVGCASCNVGTCLLKDIVDIHDLAPETERDMMTAIARVVHPDRELSIPLRGKKAALVFGKPAFSPPIQKLIAEHTFIKRWAALIPRVVKTLDLDTEDGRRLVLQGIDFVRSYADKYHHAKEEDILFKYFDGSLDILKVMHEDHEAARAHVRVVADSLEQRNASVVKEHFLAYAALLEEHIKKEDEILYPWMDRQLTDSQVGRLFAEFQAVDAAFGTSPRRHERFVEELEMQFGSAPDSARDRPATGG